MTISITVRDIDPGDKSWLRREARHIGVSMEELVRRLISRKAREDRASAETVRGVRAAFRGGSRRRTSAAPPRLQVAAVQCRKDE